jgi:hypothetical protein
MEVARLTSTGIEEKKNEMAKEDYKKRLKDGTLPQCVGRDRSFDQYKQIFYWHIHEVDLI